jgi:Ca2+-binding EF-hand superfamily protein
MRRPRWSLAVVGCLLLALVTADRALAQRGGRGGGGRFDPSWMFNRYANGKDYVVIAEVTSERTKTALTDYAQRKGITNGRLTREQFADYLQERFTARMTNRGPQGTAPASPAPSTAPAADDPAKQSFDRLDANKDGVLTDSEMPEGLRADLSKWDSNRDGKIQLDEYRAYFKANAPADAAVPNLDIVTRPSLEELDKRATVYRAGNLPPELQRTWFEELDTDKDGQIGLYEWRAGGRSLAEFRAIDANGDGFITAEEALRWVRKHGGGNTGAAGVGGQVNFGRDRSAGDRPAGYGRRQGTSDGSPGDRKPKRDKGPGGRQRGTEGPP